MSVSGVNIGGNRIMVLGLPAYDPSGSAGTRGSSPEGEGSLTLTSGIARINLGNSSATAQTGSFDPEHLSAAQQLIASMEQSEYPLVGTQVPAEQRHARSTRTDVYFQEGDRRLSLPMYGNCSRGQFITHCVTRALLAQPDCAATREGIADYLQENFEQFHSRDQGALVGIVDMAVLRNPNFFYCPTKQGPDAPERVSLTPSLQSKIQTLAGLIHSPTSTEAES